MIPPPTVSQRLIEFMYGKATSRAPLCNGIAKFIRPLRSGMPTKKTMIVPWVENNWAKWSGETIPGCRWQWPAACASTAP